MSVVGGNKNASNLLAFLSLLSAMLVLIPLFLEDWGLLPSVFRRSHIAHYAPAASLI